MVLFVALDDIARHMNGDTLGIAMKQLRNSPKLANSSTLVYFTCMDFSEIFSIVMRLFFGLDYAAI